MPPGSTHVAEALREELRQLAVLQDRLARDPRGFRREWRALEPGCAEAQADGVPCTGPHEACERCVRALAHARALRVSLESLLSRREAWRPDPRDP